MNGRAPGVYIEPADPSARPIAPARTDVAAFIGIAERGPLDQPVRVTSFKEFVRTFGSFFAPAYLGYAVRAFFENGGIAAWIVRVAAPAVGTTVTAVIDTRLSLAPPLPLLAGTVVALSQTQPGDVVARVMRRVADADPAGAWIDVEAPLTGVDARETPALDLTQAILLSTGANAAQAQVRNDLGAVVAVAYASSPGSWGNGVALRLVRDTIAQTSATATPSAAGGTLPVASPAGFARGAFVRVTQGAQPPVYRVVSDVDAASSALIVATTDPGRAVLPALNVGLPASFALTPGSPPITVEALALHLLVLESGQVVEDYDGCSPFFPDAWNARLRNAGSRVTFDATSFPPPAFDLSGWPADVDAEPLAGGTDGVRMLSPTDLIGGLDALDPVREPTLIAMPDACASGAVPLRPIAPPPIPPVCTDPQFLVAPYVPPVPAPAVAALPPDPVEGGPAFSVDQSAQALAALVEFCDVGWSPDADFPPHPSFRFAIVDVPQGANPLDFRGRFDAARAAMQWPWCGVYDPLGPAGAVRFVPPSGHVAGAFAATDLALGVHHAAANSELLWTAAVQTDIAPNDVGVYNDAQVNCIRALPNRGIRLYGARTLASDAEWLYVPVRRLVSMIENALLQSMQWSVFEPNNPTLRALVRRSCLTLLETLWQMGAFAGTSPDQAYYVTCDGTNNSPADQAAGKLTVDIGIAPVRPAEFIVFRVGHQHDTLEVFEDTAA